MLRKRQRARRRRATNQRLASVFVQHKHSLIFLFQYHDSAGTLTRMNTATKTGRPRKPDADARSARVAFRVTEDELRDIKAAAALRKLSISEYARAKATQHLPSYTPPKAKPGPNALALSELNRVGVNLWQITRSINFGGSIPNDLSDAITDVRAAVAKLAEND